jgi:hypothetical protein
MNAPLGVLAETNFPIAPGWQSPQSQRFAPGSCADDQERQQAMTGYLSVDRRGAEPADIERATATLWAELVFDDTARAALRRDGLSLEGVRITGPSPFSVQLAETSTTHVTVSANAANETQRNDLLALWHVYFMKRVVVARAA